ncbi:MAG: TIGR04282 family arsenosugar biosynthesis glycosyltransferase [Thermoanaerobaculia bacterium]
MLKSFPVTKRPRQRLLVFARVPELGKVKTRVASEIGLDRALRLYQSMLADLLESMGASSDGIEIEVLWTAESDVSGEILAHWFGDLETAEQSGRDLGERMTVAISERIFFHGAEKIVVIGTDDPTLSRPQIELCFRILDGCEWVVGPAEDGGYYLIGCRNRAFTPAVFEGIEWGASTVFESTLDRIRHKAASVTILPRRSDIDRAEDLRTLPPDRTSPRVGQTLREWGWIS